MENDKNFENQSKNSADRFAEGAKSSANEFKEGWNQTASSTDNKKILAGLLAIFLGYLGVHKFILGYNKEGFILLGATVGLSILSCFAIGFFFLWIPGVIGLIEGIIYLTKTDAEFYQTYQVGRKPWF